MIQHTSGPRPEQRIAIAIIGSGGAGAITVGNLLLAACARSGYYGMLTRAVGPQIRGGEAAALLYLGSAPVNCIADRIDILLALDWKNADRFSAEIPLGPDSLIIMDPEQGDIPAVIKSSGARTLELPVAKLAKDVKRGRGNMIALGVLSHIIGLPVESVRVAVQKQLAEKGEQAIQSSMETIDAGRAAASQIKQRHLKTSDNKEDLQRWMLNGNQAIGYGAVRGGIRFVAAYPITPATEVLEWMSSALARVGGRLVQAEDELASINMIIGASFGGVPAMTATSGPGFSLMTEGIGLAVSAEVPVVIVDVMRVGPSTGIATKAEQSDLNIAVYGFHGDAPHLVLAPLSVKDCIFTAQWSVSLAEALQVPAVVLSDQYLGQALSIIDPPDDIPFHACRTVADRPGPGYQRYQITENGVSPMAIPGTPGGEYTADGLEHAPTGTPSTRAEDHMQQMDKRSRKLTAYDYGDHWAEVEGDGDMAIITWGSSTVAVREALRRLRKEGTENVRLVAIRLLAPAQPARFAEAIQGVSRVLVVEQSHAAQFYHFLRSSYPLPEELEVYHRAGPLLFRPGEIVAKIKSWGNL